MTAEKSQTPVTGSSGRRLKGRAICCQLSAVGSALRLALGEPQNEAGARSVAACVHDGGNVAMLQFRRLEITPGVFLSACQSCKRILAISDSEEELEDAERHHACHAESPVADPDDERAA